MEMKNILTRIDSRFDIRKGTEFETRATEIIQNKTHREKRIPPKWKEYQLTVGQLQAVYCVSNLDPKVGMGPNKFLRK